MATSLELVPELLESAVKVGRHRTPQDAVEAALVEYVNRRKQPEIIKLFGKIDYDRDHDYKEARR